MKRKYLSKHFQATVRAWELQKLDNYSKEKGNILHFKHSLDFKEQRSELTSDELIPKECILYTKCSDKFYSHCNEEQFHLDPLRVT